MTFAIPKRRPEPVTENVELKPGWFFVIFLFLMTILTAVTFHQFLHLPPFLGMTTGLTYFMVYGYSRRMLARKYQKAEPVDVLQNIADVEWDTLLFFFGVIMCVGGLSEFGYLHLASEGSLWWGGDGRQYQRWIPVCGGRQCPGHVRGARHGSGDGSDRGRIALSVAIGHVGCRGGWLDAVRGFGGGGCTHGNGARGSTRLRRT